MDRACDVRAAARRASSSRPTRSGASRLERGHASARTPPGVALAEDPPARRRHGLALAPRSPRFADAPADRQRCGLHRAAGRGGDPPRRRGSREGRRARLVGDVRSPWAALASHARARAALVDAHPWDRNKRLWGGLRLHGAGGDELPRRRHGLQRGGFRAIGERFPRIDWAMLPIGAYEPEWFMQPQHMGPGRSGARVGAPRRAELRARCTGGRSS